MAVSEQKVVLPDIQTPWAYVGNQPVYISPEWYQAIQKLVDLVNATKDEVDTQHP